MRKSVSRLLVGAFIVATGVLGHVIAARAAPTGCHVNTELPGDKAEAWCTSGKGSVRVVVECTIFPPGRDPVSNPRKGPWVLVGARSTHECAGGAILTDAWYEISSLPPGVSPKPVLPR